MNSLKPEIIGGLHYLKLKAVLDEHDDDSGYDDSSVFKTVVRSLRGNLSWIRCLMWKFYLISGKNNDIDYLELF